MKTSALILLPLTQFAANNGIYDGISPNFSGASVKGPAYYGGFAGLATVAIFTNGFVGTLVIEATLDSDPLTATWVQVVTRPGSIITPLSVSEAIDIHGNYTWIRARLADYTGGSVSKVTLAY